MRADDSPSDVLAKALKQLRRWCEHLGQRSIKDARGTTVEPNLGDCDRHGDDESILKKKPLRGAKKCLSSADEAPVPPTAEQGC